MGGGLFSLNLNYIVPILHLEYLLSILITAMQCSLLASASRLLIFPSMYFVSSVKPLGRVRTINNPATHPRIVVPPHKMIAAFFTQSHDVTVLSAPTRGRRFGRRERKPGGLATLTTRRPGRLTIDSFSLLASWIFLEKNLALSFQISSFISFVSSLGPTTTSPGGGGGLTLVPSGKNIYETNINFTFILALPLLMIGSERIQVRIALKKFYILLCTEHTRKTILKI